MKNAILAAITACAAPALAHWNYNSLIVNGVVTGAPYEYIRRTNNSNSPLQDVYSTDMRCNAGASSGAALNTSTLTVRAGDELGFVVESTFGHPGIQQVYLSRVPPAAGSGSGSGSAAASYDGSGGWARIWSVSTLGNATSNVTFGSEGLLWAMRRTHSFRFPLAPDVPPGEYLLRAEGLALHAAHKLDNAQFYVACAQIRVEGAGTGTPGPLVKIPGFYNDTEPGILIPEFWTRIQNYTEPGPALWPEGTYVQHVARPLDGEVS